LVGMSKGSRFWVNDLNGNGLTDEEEIITPAQVDGWLEQLPENTPVNIIIDAYQSGAFVQELSQLGRVVVTSTEENGPVGFGLNGWLSFSQFFFSKVREGDNIHRAHLKATGAMRDIPRIFRGQNPQLEDEGNGRANETTDGVRAVRRWVGYSDLQQNLPPQIQGISLPQAIELEKPAVKSVLSRYAMTTAQAEAGVAIHAYVEDYEKDLKQIKGIIISPNSFEPLRKITLTNAGGQRYEATLTGMIEPGIYAILIMAEDGADNLSDPKQTLVTVLGKDETSPVMAILSPEDNVLTQSKDLVLTGTVNEPSIITVRVNGGEPIPAALTGQSFTAPLTLTYGLNTLDISATDETGNNSTLSRIITLDDQGPVINMTDPAQDMVTNKDSVTLRGEVSDLTAAAVSIAADGLIYLPTVINNRFEQVIPFPQEKAYPMTVTATDALGNVASVYITVTCDKTAPVLTVDGKTELYNQNEQTFTGTREAGLTVAVSCTTATVGTVEYPTVTTWHATLTNMAPGNHQITVTTTDAAGNTATHVVSCTVKQVKTGDVNGDTVVDLTDAILALRVMAGMNIPGDNVTTTGAAISGDGKIGLPSAIYIIQEVAGMR